MKLLFIAAALSLTAGMAAELALLQPREVADRLSAKGARPTRIYVGPNLLYRAKHIPGSIYAGPGSRADGLEMLKAAVAKVSREQEIILYCGCCPWDRCPNITPAAGLLKQMGFKRVKAMMVENNFASDWTAKGFPVEAGH